MTANTTVAGGAILIDNGDARAISPRAPTPSDQMITTRERFAAGMPIEAVRRTLAIPILETHLMRIVVTGGSGRLGSFVVANLVERGYEVVNVDRDPPREPHGDTVRFIPTDLADADAVRAAMTGCDAVIHLAAIPAPEGFAPETVFVNNTRATFHVLNAAMEAGIERAAIASSGSAYGMAWAPKPFAPRYAPIDEALPLLVEDPYGLSKEVDERTAEMIHRRSGMQIAALRFHWVALPAELENVPPAGLDPATPGMANGLWGYVDARDAATACRLAIETDGYGFEAFNIVAADTLCGAATADLIARYLPETEVRAPIAGTSGGFAIDKAARLLGWAPHYTWRHPA